MVASFEKSTKSNPFIGRPRSGKTIRETVYIPNPADWGVVESGDGVTAPITEPTTVLENDPLKTVTKDKPCKICNGEDKCAISDSGNTLLCGRSTAKIGDIVNGYRCKSTSNKSSHCSHTFVKVNKSSQTTVKQSPKPTKPAMSREDRDLWNRKIISTLNLSESDRTHLKNVRGLTDQQIDNWGFRSVMPNQRLVGNDWPDNLPGYRHDKKNLAIRGAGILSPIKQLDQVIAFKVRLTEKKNDQRYTCVSSPKYTQYHIDGEQPLAVLVSDNNRFDHGFFVTEGNELKPVIVHLKYNLPVLGGGRYWHSSENHAAKFLPLVREKSTIINLAVDAGDILNSGGIPLKWVREYKFFESQGFSTRFCWWNQVSKEADDIDELPDLSSVEFINLDQFKELVREHNPEAYQKIVDDDKPLLTLAVDNTLDKPKKVKSTPPVNTEDDQIEVLYTTVENAVKNSIFQDDWVTNNGSFYNYTGQGYWQRKTEDDVRHTISLTLEKCFAWKKVAEDEYQKDFRFVTKPKIDSTYGVLKAHNHNENTGLNNRFFRCFNNCVLDLRSGELLDHQKDLLLTSKLDVDYNPGSDCPEVLKQFICKAYGENKLDIIRAVLATFLNPSAPYGIFLYVVGKSGSGKGTLLRFISSLFHNKMSLKNFSIISNPDKLHQFLRDCDICLFPDVSSDFSGELETFYELVDNGESGARRLYSDDGYQKKFNTRFAVGSVNPIRVENAQGGWARRALILKTNPLNQKDKDYYLEQKLADCKAEAISWAMGLDAKERDRIIHEYMNFDKDLQNIKFEHEITSDSIKGFIDSCLRPTDTENPISTNTMYFYYKAYCYQFGYRAMSANTFKIRMKGAVDEFFFKNSKQQRVKGSNQRFRTEAAFVHLTPVKVNIQDQGRYSPHNFEDCTFVSTSDGGYRVNPKFCINGGLEAIYTFMEEKTLKIKFEEDFVTVVTTAASAENVASVTAEKLAMTELQDLSQLSQLSQGKILLSEKFENSHNDHSSSDPINNDHIYRVKKSPCDKRDNCDKPSNLYIDSLSAVTPVADGGVAAVVTTVTNLENSTNIPNAPTAPPSIKMQLGDFKVGDRIQLEPQSIPDYNKISPIIADVVMVYEGVDGWEVVFYEYERWNKQDQKYEPIGGEFGRGSVLSGWVKTLAPATN
ncbi:primase-like DNA-binding domain-containing protein [Cuspidothrix issatschenkoi]|uniref:Bacteriophage/plasmid primase P4 C-terminal domain-containing protein n=1 Tax=Cuspidothrix issatschenkoi CHARLIE-1 TaxID=2052836 RepID=A0A2S6CYL9_9CYAN|nr:primase-like DNA-binding domain-containing protein [Cuspidothrix issatschenkoi]PPJ64791.1 hypothetical protein CUN59_03010 [Cuspidothrix issatschenkoi CHARLIE-1]